MKIAEWESNALLRQKRWVTSGRCRSDAKKSLMKWKPLKERLIYLRLYTSNLKISLIVNFPTNKSTEEMR